MKIDKESLVLYSINVVKGDQRAVRSYEKPHLANALGIAPSTLDLYLTRLSGSGQVKRIKKKFINDLRKTIEITESGKRRVHEIESDMDKLLLTEERHNLPACVSLDSILDHLPDPLEKIFFLALYNQNKFFDLPMLLKTLRLSKEDTNLVNMFSDIDANPYGKKNESFTESFFHATLYTAFDKRMLDDEEWSKEDVNALIVLAQSKIRMGKLEDARMIHEYLLSDRVELTTNQWFIVKMDRAYWFHMSGRLEDAIASIGSLLDILDDKVQIAYARMTLALYKFYLGDRSEYKMLFKQAIQSLNTHKVPIFLVIAYNNRGICHFMYEEYDEAEEDWKKARRYAKETKSSFMEARVLVNLADMAMKHGNFQLAERHLDFAEKVFSEMHDLEGIAYVEFNRCLSFIDQGDLEKAMEHHERCRTVAFPLPPRHVLEIFKGEILKRARAKGLDLHIDPS